MTVLISFLPFINSSYTCVTVVERIGPVAVRHFDPVSFWVEFCTWALGRGGNASAYVGWYPSKSNPSSSSKWLFKSSCRMYPPSLYIDPWRISCPWLSPVPGGPLILSIFLKSGPLAGQDLQSHCRKTQKKQQLLTSKLEGKTHACILIHYKLVANRRLISQREKIPLALSNLLGNGDCFR